jgi:hypothetical protein
MTPEEFWNILHAETKTNNPIYRLYYNDLGEPLFYATEDLPGNYIEIDQETFSRANSQVRVKNGQLVSTVAQKISKKLAPSEHGTACDVRDVCVVVNSTQPHTKWTIKIYE